MSLTSLNVQSRPEWESSPVPSGLSRIPLVTAVLIASNVLVFLIMLFRGVPFFDPKSSDLLAWGANFGPLTTSGQWWRLLSACFVHAGIIHIAFNMYILFQIGWLTEGLFGKPLFLLLYLASGVCGNIAGLFLHPLTTSVGASGAIFGLYGGLFAFLLVRRAHLNKERTRPILTNAALFLGYNLIYGLASPTTDLVAHLGGLVSGFAFGCPLALFRGPVPLQRRSLGATLGLSLAALAALAVWKLPRSTPAGAEFYHQVMTGTRISAGFAGTLIYTGTTTPAQAKAVADVLVEMGFYKGVGAVTLLQETAGSASLSLPLKSRQAPSATSATKPDAKTVAAAPPWDNPAFVGDFQFFGPRLASAAGGLPFQIRFLDDSGNVMRILPIDGSDTSVSGKDRISFFGEATAKDAAAVTGALQAAGYFKDTGAIVLLSKQKGVPEITFFIPDDQWDDPKLTFNMAQISLRAAQPLGGPPLNVKLVNKTRRQQRSFSLAVKQTRPPVPKAR